MRRAKIGLHSAKIGAINRIKKNNMKKKKIETKLKKGRKTNAHKSKYT